MLVIHLLEVVATGCGVHVPLQKIRVIHSLLLVHCVPQNQVVVGVIPQANVKLEILVVQVLEVAANGNGVHVLHLTHVKNTLLVHCVLLMWVVVGVKEFLVTRRHV